MQATVNHSPSSCSKVGPPTILSRRATCRLCIVLIFFHFDRGRCLLKKPISLNCGRPGRLRAPGGESKISAGSVEEDESLLVLKK